MNKSALAKAIKAEMGTDADGISACKIGAIITSMTDVIAFSIRQKDPVQIRNLCTFIPVIRPTRKGNFPGHSSDIPESEGVKAKFSGVFIKSLN